MHRAVLTPKRLISNLFAISPYIVKVIPLAEIAVDSLLPVDFGHGQFTRADRDFILQKTILSRQLWKQTARRKYGPCPRAHPRDPRRPLAEQRCWQRGARRPISPPPVLLSTGHAWGGGWRGPKEMGCSPLPEDPLPTVGASHSPSFPHHLCKPPAAPLSGWLLVDRHSHPTGGTLSACTQHVGGRMVASIPGLPSLVTLVSPPPVPQVPSGKAWCHCWGIFSDVWQGGLDVHPLFCHPTALVTPGTLPAVSWGSLGFPKVVLSQAGNAHPALLLSQTKDQVRTPGRNLPLALLREPCLRGGGRGEQSPCTQLNGKGSTPGPHLTGGQGSRMVYPWGGSHVPAGPWGVHAERAWAAAASPSLTLCPAAGNHTAWTLLMSSKSKPAAPGLQSGHQCRKGCITACGCSLSVCCLRRGLPCPPWGQG